MPCGTWPALRLPHPEETDLELTNASLWGAFFAIIAANILLSGDNAVVIAMAARSLPPKP